MNANKKMTNYNNNAAGTTSNKNYNYNYQWPSARIVNSEREWSLVDKEFFRSIGPLGIIGLDCEWVEPQAFAYKENRERWQYYSNTTITPDADATRIENGSAGKVALLQLASHRGIVLLVRLCYFHEIPASLKNLIQDPYILKLGVNIETDAKKLFLDWDVQIVGFVDIRNVVARNPRFLDEYEKSGMGLKKLGNFLTGSNYCDEKKDNKVRFSHWACRELTNEQIYYARNDAVAAVEGIYCFAIKYMHGLPDPPERDRDQFAEKLRKALFAEANRTCSEYVAGILDRKRQSASAAAADEYYYHVDDEAAKAAAYRAEERRKQRAGAKTMDESDSEIEMDFDKWKRSGGGHCRRRTTAMADGANRARVFRDQRGVPMAAVDAGLLREAKSAKEPLKLRFDVKNAKGDAVYEARMELRKE